MRRIVLLAVCLAALSVPARAVDAFAQEQQILQVDSLTQGLPDEAQQAMEGLSPASRTDAGTAILRIIRWAAQLSVSALPDAVRTGAMLLAAALICSLVRPLQPGQTSLPVLTLTGAAAICLIFTGSMRSMASLAGQMLDEMEAYSKLLLPVMSAAATASGAPAGGSVLYVGSTLFFSVLTSAIRALLLPLVYAFLALSTLECGMDDARLGSVRQLAGWSITAILKGIMYVFTAYLAVTGLLSGSADEAAVDAAKSTLSAAIPVVGGIVADASEAVLQSARLLRATAGTFGILAVLAMALVPFLKIAICYITMKITAAIAGLTAGKAHAALLTHLAAAMGYLLAMTGCTAVMMLLGTTCFLKVAAG